MRFLAALGIITLKGNVLHLLNSDKNVQVSAIKYSIALFSDTTLHDTVRIDMAYNFFDMGKRYYFANLVPDNENYIIEVFSKRPTDSLGLLTERFLLDTTYSVSRKMFTEDLRRDLKKYRSEKSPSKKSPLLTEWTYSFTLKDTILASFHEIKTPFLYLRLRFNSTLVSK